MIVGMDFGTTNSGMAVYDGDQLRLIPLDPANANPHVARTAMYITNDRNVHIGRAATDVYYEQNLNRPFKLERVRVGEVEMTFAEIGTFIRDVYIEKDIYAPGRLFLSFKTGLASTRYLGTVVGNEYYFLEDIIALYLFVTRKRAETFLHTTLDTIVLGRPVRYSDDPTQNALAQERMLQAAFRAGYTRVYLQYEPIAAAYAYEATIDQEENVLIFDFGGGTLDISIMRLGNPKTRQVLATGGIPIAGDVFDQKIVRAKLPKHFGEGTSYHHGDQDLPIPKTYFEAFSNWQDLLALQLPDMLHPLKEIAKTAHQPRKLKALVNLITSQYGLKIYDVAEASKRAVSNNPLSLLKLDGPEFKFNDSLTRGEFERIIRPEVRAIAARLDEVINKAGLHPNEIDVVIRTGGSSQIPVFIDMLCERFGRDKVRDIDAFSSVTSGLGLIAHEVEIGQNPLRLYTPDTQSGGDYLDSAAQGGIPVVNLDMMRQIVSVVESRTQSEQSMLAIIGQTDGGHLHTTLRPADELTQELPLERYTLPTPRRPMDIVLPDERLLLMTSEYRALQKTGQQLADLHTIGTTLETAEAFQSDAFGSETVCAINRWCDIEGAERAVMVTTRGYVRLFVGKSFAESLNQPMPYQLIRSQGYPAALFGIGDKGDVIIITHAGRAIRYKANKLTPNEQRLINIPTEGHIIGAFFMDIPRDILIATASGYAKRVLATEIPLAKLNSSGEKIIGRSYPVIALPHDPYAQLVAITNRRILPIDQTDIPRANLDTTDYKLIKLRSGESLVSLTYIPRQT